MESKSESLCLRAICVHIKSRSKFTNVVARKQPQRVFTCRLWKDIKLGGFMRCDSCWDERSVWRLISWSCRWKCWGCLSEWEAGSCLLWWCDTQSLSLSLSLRDWFIFFCIFEIFPSIHVLTHTYTLAIGNFFLRRLKQRSVRGMASLSLSRGETLIPLSHHT